MNGESRAQPGNRAPRGSRTLTILGLTAQASPAILRQINPMNQPHAVQVAVIRPVTLAGYVSDNSNVTPTVSFQVIDQNGRHMPSGTITPQVVAPGVFFFSTRFGLNRTRLPATARGDTTRLL